MFSPELNTWYYKAGFLDTCDRVTPLFGSCPARPDYFSKEKGNILRAIYVSVLPRYGEAEYSILFIRLWDEPILQIALSPFTLA
jgi:hypothetical protein